MKDKNINFALFILSTFGSVIMPLLLKKIKCTPLKNALRTSFRYWLHLC